jgi:molybdopterin molybdotransferase
MSALISPSEALACILGQGRPMPVQQLPLQAALGRILAEDIRSAIDHPSFDVSAVDGYALRFADLGTQPLPINTAPIKAGDAGEQPLPPGACVRIFTGAPLPPGADTVVMQEHTEVTAAGVQIQDAHLRHHGNVRFRGEQIQAGQVAMAAGQHITPAAVGYLATLGVRTLRAFAPPRVAVLVTGDEFAENDGDLQRGRIYESNGQMLRAALSGLGCAVEVCQVQDDRAAMQASLRELALRCDVLIATGGVSVGDHDHTRPALEAEGFATLLHGIAQKPGKPMYFGMREGQAAFGLPGNPRAVLVCFYVYVLPYLQACMQAARPGLKRIVLPLLAPWHRKPDGKTHFVTCRLREAGCEILDDRGSHMLRSFVEADGLVALPPAPADFPAGSLVEVLLLPT